MEAAEYGESIAFLYIHGCDVALLGFADWNDRLDCWSRNIRGQRLKRELSKRRNDKDIGGAFSGEQGCISRRSGRRSSRPMWYGKLLYK